MSAARPQPASAGPPASRPGPNRIDGLRLVVFGVALPMETFLDRLFTGLAERGALLTVVSPLPPSRQWLEARGAVWRHGPGRLGARTIARGTVERGAAVGRRLAADLVRPGRGGTSVLAGADVVYSPWLNSVINNPEVMTAGPPLVVSCRGRMVTIDPWDPRLPGQAAGLRRVFAGATWVHCVSEAMEDEAATFGLDRSRSTVITPAVDPAVFRPTEPGPRRGGPTEVIAVGSLIWRKDYEQALLAVARAVELGADLRLTIVGEGPDRQHLRFAAGELGLVDRVALVGSEPPGRVVARLQAADVFLHTSSTEGISNAVLEAMACRLPVVTTDVGGMAEAVRDGIDGHVVPPRDVDAAASALAALAADPEGARLMGAAGRARVEEHFHLDGQLDAFCDLFTRLSAVRS